MSDALKEGARASPDFRLLFESVPGNYLALDEAFRIVAVSAAFLRTTATRREDLVGRDVFAAFPEDRVTGGVSNLRASLERVLANRCVDVVPAPSHPFGAARCGTSTNTPVLGADGAVAFILHRMGDPAEDLDADRRAGDDLLVQLEAQKRALEMIVRRAPLAEILAHIALVVERLAGGRTVASILLLDGSGALRNGASPNLPADYLRAIDGIRPDANLGTCAAAAATGKVVTTPDFATDPKWTNLKHLPLGIGFTGAWSMPIMSRDGTVLGTFGTYLRERRGPTTKERQSVEILASTAAIAIEREHAEVARVGAEEALRVSDRRKDEFLAVLAHELRNPLAPISNGLSILRLKSGDVSVAERMHAMMERQVSHMIRLVDDLMEVSRISRGKVALRKERLDLRASLVDAMETSRPLVEGERHRLHIELPASPIDVEADPVRLAQVFANLLNNAARYTPEGGDIWVGVRSEDGRAVVSVRDSGAGIEPDLLRSVFDIFVQGRPGGTSVAGGLGIGLTIVRDLVALHGGSVEGRSAGAGLGAEFIVRLPLVGASSPDEGADPPRVDVPRLRVLVVDDNRDAADSLGALLRYSGVEAEVAYDGPSALAAMEIARPACVLLDLGMPDMDGFEVARRIRSRPAFDDVAIVALTGWSQQQRASTRDAGFDHHLLKPVDLASLVGVLHDLRR